MNILLICHTTRAIRMNVMTELRNAPQRIATSVVGSPGVPGFNTSLRSAKSTPPSARPMGGMMMLGKVLDEDHHLTGDGRGLGDGADAAGRANPAGGDPTAA